MEIVEGMTWAGAAGDENSDGWWREQGDGGSRRGSGTASVDSDEERSWTDALAEQPLSAQRCQQRLLALRRQHTHGGEEFGAGVGVSEMGTTQEGGGPSAARLLRSILDDKNGTGHDGGEMEEGKGSAASTRHIEATSTTTAGRRERCNYPL